ncbi:MAG: AbrB/MazE/SpoVT family DNA-binding domain-containing protein [archaeon]
MIKTIKVSDKGQIALPQSVRESLGISKGDDLVLFQLDGKILLEKTDRTFERTKDDFDDILRINEGSLNEVWDNKEDESWTKELLKENGL